MLSKEPRLTSMSTLTAEVREALYVARQPILDDRGRVFGYELLYRAAADATTCAASSDVASARVLTDAVLTVGLETLTGGRPAFVNLTRGLLVEPVSTLLPATAAVFELHEDIPIDDEVIAACKGLHAAGYQLALDDFVPKSDAEQLLPYVKFVKVDVLTTPSNVQAILAQRLRFGGIRLIAEKVESAEVFEATRALGYKLFQGNFFCRPSTRTAAVVPAKRTVYLRLLSALNAPDVTVREVESLVRTDPSLAFRILRCVNSAAYGLDREIHSISQALVLLGLDPVRKWASLWCLAGLNGGGVAELSTMALVRARTCETLGAELPDYDTRPELFLVGLCSLLDVMLGRPMDEALLELPLSKEAKRALLGQPNAARQVLDAVIAHERGDFDAAAELAAKAGLYPGSLRVAFTGALEWAREFAQEESAQK